jgi:hypothetical protein
LFWVVGWVEAILETKSAKVEIDNKNTSEESAETQTEDVDMMRCDFDEAITCNYCKEKFKTKDSVMVHRKKVHVERVSICSNFLNGTCYFETDDCWYVHTKPSVML